MFEYEKAMVKKVGPGKIVSDKKTKKVLRKMKKVRTFAQGRGRKWLISTNLYTYDT